ncbi:Gfo/Idh/MocA family oxidoreductase [Viridibacillus sp. FSL E2-0187]|uniref:Gfo/Idh/MocA family protein n=1 Tax=Viridibacillus TaxID=496496 RepID=UPI0030F7CB1A
MTIRWGILSAANIAKNFVMPAIEDAGGDILAIASRSQDLTEIQEKFQIPYTLNDYEQLLEMDEIDAVYIALPNSLHFKWIVKAIEYGKHVLCEKPIVLSLEELQTIQRKSIEKEVKVMEAFMYRFHPQILETKKLLEEGAIGEVLTIRSQFHFTLENWTDDIRVNPNLGGGALYDIGCYCINVQQFLLGKKIVTYHVQQGRKSNVDVHLTIQVQYEDGILGLIDCSFLGEFSQSVDLIGTAGSLRLPFAFRTDLNQDFGVIQLVQNGQLSSQHIEGNAYKNQIEHFHQSIEHREFQPYSFDSMLEQVTILEKFQTTLKKEGVIG